MLKKYILTAAAIILPMIAQVGKSIEPEESLEPVNKMLYGSKPEVYESAAKIRRRTANSQTENASKLLNLANEAPMEENEEQKRRRENRAGELQLQAGDLMGGASKNYQAAISNLNYCLSSLKKPSKEKVDEIKKKIEKNHADSITYQESSIEAYLLAADSFEWHRGANPERQAVSYERIATALEKIAREKP